MRIAWGVHGYGRGHAMRVHALLPALSAAHEVQLFAGGAAYDALSRRPGALRIPHLEYVYRGARISWSRTLASNAATLVDLLSGGPCRRIVRQRLEAFRPDLVISDSEPYLLRVARELRIPSIGLDHVGVIAHCRPRAPLADWPRLALDREAYLALLGRADRVVVSSFFDVPAARPGVHVVPPILRARVLEARPADRGHLLVYFNSARLFTPGVLAALAGLGAPVIAYGAGRGGREGSLEHRPFDEAAFVEDLASCRAVLATGGHQLLSEAIHLGKPMLLCPEATAEQRLNVREAERLGVGRSVRLRDLAAPLLRSFLADLGVHRAALARLERPGNARALETLARLAAEFTAGGAGPRPRGPEGRASPPGHLRVAPGGWPRRSMSQAPAAPASFRAPSAAPWVAAAVGALALLRVLFWLFAPPNSDEAYYWLWGLHPDLSYFDHPPLHAWIQGLLHAGLGRSLLVLRLPTAVTTVGTILLLARMAAQLGGERPRLTVAAALLGSPLLLMLTSFAWHDHLLVFLVVLSAKLLLEFLAEVASGERGTTWRLLLGAAALGLAGLAKYSAVFLGVGVAAAVVADRRLRRLLLDGRTWAAAVLALIVLSPVIGWNLEHGLASFRFHLVDRHLSGTGVHLRPIGLVHFLAPTLALLSPALAWAMLAALRRPAPAEAAYPRVFRDVALAAFAASTAVFLGLSLFSWSLYYWNVVAYLLLVPPAALVLASRPRLMAAHLGFGVAAAALLVVHATVLPLTALVPGVQDDDSRELFGWGEVARAVRGALSERPGFVAASDYRSGSHLAFALGSPDVVVLSGRRSAFDDWLAPEAHAGEDAVLVTDHRDPMSPMLAARFERVTHLATVPVERLGVHLKDYELWRAERFRASPGVVAQSIAGAAPPSR